jgi:hypothetical protein
VIFFLVERFFCGGFIVMGSPNPQVSFNDVEDFIRAAVY